jgi:Domain of unknown function (DUF4129)
VNPDHAAVLLAQLRPGQLSETGAGRLRGVPEIGRPAAQQLARRELARPMYQPSLWQRFLRWLGHLVQSAQAGFPGGWWALLAAAAAAVLVAVVLLAVIWPARPGRRGRPAAVFSGTQPRRTAAGHWQAAERLAAGGDYSGAIVELVRAMAAQLEEAGLLPASPGRTAAELAAEAGRAWPAHTGDLARAAQLFDDVRYGGRPGTPDGFVSVRATAARLRDARAAPTPARPARAAAGAPR